MLRIGPIALLLAAPALAQRADANPRNVRYERPVIEHVSLEPRMVVEKIGDGPRRLEGTAPVTLTFHLRNPGDAAARVQLRVQGLDAPLGEAVALEPGAAGQVRVEMASLAIPYGRTIELRSGRQVLDSLRFHSGKAHRVVLLVERRTWQAGMERFGSFVRRMRASFEALHALFADVSDPLGIDLLKREPVSARFRIDGLELYDRGSGTRIRMFTRHPQYDLAIACDEGGPAAGFFLPEYSIGHSFRAKVDGVVHGLWSLRGEQALWHEMVHYRGVGDYYIYRIERGCLEGWTKGAVDLPDKYRLDLMNSPYQQPRIGALTAHVMNFKQGVSRVGACEETAQPYGHMWTWLPRSLRVRILRDGRPVQKAAVRWWSARPAGRGDRRLQRAERSRAPDGAALTDKDGIARVRGDYLRSKRPRAERSLWLVVELSHEGESRVGIVYGLWLNAAYAAGHRDQATRTFVWKDLQPVKAR